MNSQCTINNCRNSAPDAEPFCWQHRVEEKWPVYLIKLLKRARWFVNDNLEAQESEEARVLLVEIDESLMPDALYCFTKTQQARARAGDDYRVALQAIDDYLTAFKDPLAVTIKGITSHALTRGEPQ